VSRYLRLDAPRRHGIRFFTPDRSCSIAKAVSIPFHSPPSYSHLSESHPSQPCSYRSPRSGIRPKLRDMSFDRPALFRGCWSGCPRIPDLPALPLLTFPDGSLQYIEPLVRPFSSPFPPLVSYSSLVQLRRKFASNPDRDSFLLSPAFSHPPPPTPKSWTGREVLLHPFPPDSSHSSKPPVPPDALSAVPLRVPQTPGIHH